MAVTAAQYTKSRNAGMSGDGPVAASTTLYDLTLAFWNASGYLDDDVASGVNKFAGVVSSGTVDNSSGSNGDLNAEFYQDGEFLLTGSGFAQTDIGKKVYASDNFTITESTEGTVYIGSIVKYVSATQVWVKLDVEKDEVLTLVADPGDTGSIGATSNSFYCEMTSAGAETRTLANPLKGGIVGVIGFRTDGGNITMTATTAVNATGNNTLTWADAGDSVTVVSVPSGASAYKWAILTQDGGVALSTV